MHKLSQVSMDISPMTLTTARARMNGSVLHLAPVVTVHLNSTTSAVD